MFHNIYVTRMIVIFAAAAAFAGTVFDTGLPVVEINTENGAGITSKTEYVGMTFSLADPRDPQDSGAVGVPGRIRGRGNNTWHSWWAHKKSYRVLLAEKMPLFGLEPARNWTLLAQHRDETLLYNAIPFELGRRFGMRFNHSVNFVDLYINGEYMGNYLLTEHRHVSAGRVDIDRREGWFVELDEYFDEEPKFRTDSYDLPVMIKFPKGRAAARGLPANAPNPVHDRVKNDLNALTAALADPSFPESGYREMIDMETFVAFLMINEIAANTDLSHPRSSYIHKDKDAPISMGPLWDFDSGYGWHYKNWLESGFNDHFNYPDRRPIVHPFFGRFYDDPVFAARYKETWNERYDDIASMTDYIDTMAKRLEKSAEVNFKNHWYKTAAPFTDTRPPMHIDYPSSAAKLKAWYEARVYYMNAEANRMNAVPRSKNFGTDTAGSPPSVRQRFTLVSIGKMAAPSASLQQGDASPFEIAGMDFSQTSTGRGAYIAPFVTVRPKDALPTGYHHDTLMITVQNRGCVLTTAVPLDYTVAARPAQTLNKPDAPTRKKRGRWPKFLSKSENKTKTKPK